MKTVNPYLSKRLADSFQRRWEITNGVLKIGNKFILLHNVVCITANINHVWFDGHFFAGDDLSASIDVGTQEQEVILLVAEALQVLRSLSGPGSLSGAPTSVSPQT